MGALLTAAQLLGVLAIVAGVAMWSVPAGLIVGGLLVVGLCEVAEYRRPAPPEPGPHPNGGSKA